MRYVNLALAALLAAIASGLALGQEQPAPLPAPSASSPAGKGAVEGSAAGDQTTARSLVPIEESIRPGGSSQTSASELSHLPDFKESGAREFDAEAQLPRRRFAVCIGIDGYPLDGPYRPLQYAGADAISMAEAFLLKANFDQVLLMTDTKIPPALATTDLAPKLKISDKLTRNELRDNVEAFVHQANRYEDVLVFYFAGHGDNNGRQGFLVPADYGTPESPRPLNISEMFGCMYGNPVRARHKLFIIDACRSAVDDANGRVMVPALRKDLLEPGERLTIFTGCDAHQSSHEDPTLKHGRFTWALLDALMGGGFRPGEEYLLESDLYLHVTKTFVERKWDKQQTPQHFSSGTHFALAHRAVAKPQPLDEYEWEKLKADHAAAKTSYRAGELERASSAYRYALRVVESAPKNDAALTHLHGQLLFERALVQYRLGHGDEAQALREAGLKLRTDSPVLAELEAYDLAAAGKERAALDRLQAAIDQTPEREYVDAYTWSRKAALEESLSDFAAATHSYGEAALASHRAGNRQAADLFLDQIRSLTFEFVWLQQARMQQRPEIAIEAFGRCQTVTRAILGDNHWRSQSDVALMDAVQKQSRLPLHMLRAIWEAEVLYERLNNKDNDPAAESISRFLSEREAELLGATHPWRANSLMNTGRRLRDQGRNAEAVAELSQALANYRQHYGDDHPFSIEAALLIAGALRAQDKESEAGPYIQLASEHLDAQLATLTGSHSTYSKSRAATLLYNVDRFQEAVPLFEAAATAYEARHDLANAAWMRSWLADCHRELKQDERALQEYQASLAVFREIGNEKGIAFQLSAVAKTLFRLKRYEEALPIFAQAEEAYAMMGGRSTAAWMHDWTGDTLRKLKRGEEALPRYERAEATFRDLEQPKDVAEVLYEVGETHYELRNYEQAFAQMETARLASEASGLTSKAAWSITYQGVCRWKQGRDDLALPLYEQAAERFRAFDHQEDLSTLSLLTAQALIRLNRRAESIGHLEACEKAHLSRGQVTLAARARMEIGAAFRYLKREDEAQAAFRGAHSLLVSAPNRDAFTEDVLAQSLYLLGRYEEGSLQFVSARDAYEREQQPAKAAGACDWQGLCLMELERYADAEAAYAEALRRFAACEHQDDVANVIKQHAKCLYHLKRYDEAIAEFEEAAKSFHGRLPADAAWMHSWLGDCYRSQDKDERAVASYEESLRRFAAVQHRESIAIVRHSLADTLRRMDRHDEASVQFLAACAAYEQEGNQVQAAWMHGWIGVGHVAAREWERALAAFDESVKRFTELKFERGIAVVHFRRGEVLRRLDRTSDAIADFEVSAATSERMKQAADEARARSQIAACHCELGQDEKAAPFYQASLTLFKQAQMPDEVIETASDLGRTLYELKRYDDAATAYDEAWQVAGRQKDLPAAALAAEMAAGSFAKGGRIDDAKRYYDIAEKGYVQLQDEAKAQEMRAARESLKPMK